MKFLAASVLVLGLLGTTAANADVGMGVHVGGVGAGVHLGIGDHHRDRHHRRHCVRWGHSHHHRYCRGWGW